MDLTSNLHPDDQEEDRHQRVIDPEMQGLGEHPTAQTDRQRRVPERVVAGGEWRVGPDQGNCGRNQQHDAADSFDVEKAVESRESAFGQKLSTRKCLP